MLALVGVLAAPLWARAEKQSKEETKLIKRVEQFYRLFVSAEWSKVEPFVTPE
ncbi:MAG: hypothetical protein HY719_01330, partial [Planctomycetes bacterium]|nr:hypothetical protein [Planctomycetota bacterium]